MSTPLIVESFCNKVMLDRVRAGQKILLCLHPVCGRGRVPVVVELRERTAMGGNYEQNTTPV